MTEITLKQLRYFEALARHAHFGRAADVCSVSQPALSMQIKELETSLGGALVERGPRQVRLTPLGESVRVRTREILGSVEALVEHARAVQGEGLSRLRLGVIPTVAPYLLPQLITQLDRAHPGLDLHVRETLTARLVQGLTDGEIDAAVVALPVSEPQLEEVALFEETFVLVRPASDARAPIPDIEALQTMRLLLLEEGHCFRDQALAFCNLKAARPREGLDGSALTTLVQMVAAGLGVTLIPQMAVAVEAQSPGLDVVRFPEPQPRRTIGMIWRKGTALAPHLHQIAQAVRAAHTRAIGLV